MISPLSAKQRIICAIDTDDLDFAAKLAGNLKDFVGGFKLGLEFFTAHGPAGIAKIQSLGMPIMLDLKFHDIPNTVYGAVRAAARMKVAMMTIHSSGNSDMMRRAVDASVEVSESLSIEKPLLFGVTVLTSLDDDDLTELGYKQKTSDRVKRLAEMAQLCGLSGVVASPRELSLLQEQRSRDFRIITPGIRPAWASESHDQKRVMDPAQAIRSGADYIVIGRPITRAPDPVWAAKKILQEVEAAV